MWEGWDGVIGNEAGVVTAASCSKWDHEDLPASLCYQTFTSSSVSFLHLACLLLLLALPPVDETMFKKVVLLLLVDKCMECVSLSPWSSTFPQVS